MSERSTTAGRPLQRLVCLPCTSSRKDIRKELDRGKLLHLTQHLHGSKRGGALTGSPRDVRRTALILVTSLRQEQHERQAVRARRSSHRRRLRSAAATGYR